MSKEADVTRPVVAHVTRAFLNPTESFIQNQITYAQRYRPIVASHHEREGALATVEGMAATAMLTGPMRLLDLAADRALRASSPWATQAMARFVEARGAKILHFHFLTNARSYLSLRRRTRLPAVVSAYGYDVSSFPRRWGGLGRQYLAPIFRHAECFLAMSEEMRRDLVAIGCPPERIRVHYHGIPTRRFVHRDRRYSPDGTLTILSCGRLIPIKGQGRVVAALALVRRRCRVPFRLVLVGEGPLRLELQRTIERLGMEDVVDLTGHIAYQNPTLVGHYHRADLFTLASAIEGGGKEGIPGVIVEAMAAGLPIVSTYHGGIPSVIDHGREGLLVPEHDVAALADALESLITNPELRERLGTAAARRATTQLDVAPATAALERIYDSLL